MAFPGFPQAGLDFLAELRANNTREWFEENKQRYIDDVRTPAQEFVHLYGERLQDILPGIRYDTATNGSGSLMRINRDVRFSADKSPYKTNVAMIFWDGPGKKMQHPGIGFQIQPESTGGMGGLFNFDKPMLAAYREAVVDESLGAELVAILTDIQKDDSYHFEGEHYKKIPRGFPSDHPRADWLKFAGLWASLSGITNNVVTSPQFFDMCVHHAEMVAPLVRWLKKVEGRIKVA